MKTIQIFAVVACLSMLSIISNAQNLEFPWLIGTGPHAVDYTSTDPIGEGFFDVNDWNAEYPFSTLWIARTLHKNFALETSISAGSVAEFPASTQVRRGFIDLDLALLIKTNSSGFFDPYLRVGGGMNSVNKIAYGMGTVGAGMNFWYNENVGLNIQTAYDFVPSYKNYFHHRGGIVFRPGSATDTDGDGVVDSKDDCPLIPGLAALAGCPDSDEDGIVDSKDECPNLAGPLELMGCPDTDGDGIIDTRDACPTARGPLALKGCPDSDGDGIANNMDDCPSVKGSPMFNGCPDTDNDGIADNLDKCPTEAGTKENNGCPNADPVKTPNEVLNLLLAQEVIEFETASSVIRITSYDDLNTIVKIMKENPNNRFRIEGHTDDQGGEARNLQLSRERATAVLIYVVDNGADYRNIYSIGYGESRPIATNDTPEGRQKNRRVVITAE